MPFAVICPKCAYGFRVPDAVHGKRGKCPKCQAIFVANPAGESQAAKATVASPAQDETLAAVPQAKALAIPKPRMLAALKGETPPAEAVPPQPPSTAAPPPAPPDHHPTAPSAVAPTPTIQVKTSPTGGAASASIGTYAKRRRRLSLGPIVLVVGLVLVCLLALGAGAAWSLLDTDSMFAQASSQRKGAGDAKDGDSDGREVGLADSGATTRTTEMPDLPAASEPNVSHQPQGDENGSGGPPEREPRNRPAPTASPPVVRPEGASIPNNDPLRGPLASFQKLHLLLKKTDWRPAGEADYEGFQQFAFLLTVSEEFLGEGLGPAQKERVHKATGAALEDIGKAPWPSNDDIRRINRLAVAPAARENPGVYAYGRCVMRPEDFGARSINGLPLLAFELVGTEEIVIVPSGINAGEVRHGSTWLILGRQDPDESFPAFELPDQPGMQRKGTVVRANFLIGGGE